MKFKSAKMQQAAAMVMTYLGLAEMPIADGKVSLDDAQSAKLKDHLTEATVNSLIDAFNKDLAEEKNAVDIKASIEALLAETDISAAELDQILADAKTEGKEDNLAVLKAIEQKMVDQKRQADSISLGTLKINFSSQRASMTTSSGDLPIEFSSTEFKILSFLARNLDQVKSREQIIAAVWSDGLHLSDRTVDSHISRIRKKLGNSTCLIEAVPGAGYRLLVLLEKKTAKRAA